MDSSPERFAHRINELAKTKVPFLFIADFEIEKPVVIPLDQIDPNTILYSVDGFTNAQRTGELGAGSKAEILEKYPLSFNAYTEKFEKVMARLQYGDSFLTNLTVKTEVAPQHSLYELFFLSDAKFKLWWKDQFLVFSPERFVRIEGNKIYAYPMKGTIDSAIPRAAEKILSDEKELAEHITIVDLIRNDLSQVATDVSVTRFRYIDELRTNHKTLLQVSSEITGTLAPDFGVHLGDLLLKMLPAGSVSGAPKPKTLEIIKDAEEESRGYYTGVFGYFNGERLDSGVMIRFIEHQKGKYFYRSGGGITTQSNVHAEYEEVINKVYVPLAGVNKVL